MGRSLRVSQASWPIIGQFTISRGSKTTADMVLVELKDGDHVGRGEAVPYGHYDESLAAVESQILSLKRDIELGLDRTALNETMEPGAARNALDCALWDLQAKQAGKRVWDLIGIPDFQPLTTAYTLSLDKPEVMGDKARAVQHLPLLKLKLAGPDDLDRVAAVRQGAPKARIIVDANEGWTPESYQHMAPKLAALGVDMIEQPLPAGDDAILGEMDRVVPVCADESCHGLNSLAAIEGKYDMINIKLDKTGGLTEALALKTAAMKSGLKIMVGSMLAPSLAMAPAMVVAQGCDLVDLDGPLLLSDDHPNPIRYVDAVMMPPEAALWG